MLVSLGILTIAFLTSLVYFKKTNQYCFKEEATKKKSEPIEEITIGDAEPEEVEF